MTDYGHDLQFGVFLTPAANNPGAVTELAVLADQEGLDLVTFQDHPYQARFLDTWTLLAFVAARTSRVHLAANVVSLPLRPPAVLARAVASLDHLSGGRVELGIGAGAFWDGIAGMGGRRLTPGQAVDALDEGIDVIRMLWDTKLSGRATFNGSYYQLNGAARSAPDHEVGIWIGAYKPRMLNLVGQKGDGWLPSLPYLEPGALAAGNKAIDEAALKAGRKPSDILRLLNVAGGPDSAYPEFQGPPQTWVGELTRMAVEDGISSFILMGDDATQIRVLASEIAPAVREAVTRQRLKRRSATDRPERPEPMPTVDSTKATAAATDRRHESEYDRLGVKPAIDDGVRRSSKAPWDESKRPHRLPSGPDVTYTARGRTEGQHLIEIHDALRAELSELRDIMVRVRKGGLTAAGARATLNEMALRQNDWALGAFCSRYCGIVTLHHRLEDLSVFPGLTQGDPALEAVIKRLRDEHLVIHDAIEAVDAALVRHINHADGFTEIEAALDFLTDSLLSHFAYEEQELVEPLARLGS